MWEAGTKVTLLWKNENNEEEGWGAEICRSEMGQACESSWSLGKDISLL